MDDFEADESGAAPRLNSGTVIIESVRANLIRWNFVPSPTLISTLEQAVRKLLQPHRTPRSGGVYKNHNA